MGKKLLEGKFSYVGGEGGKPPQFRKRGPIVSAPAPQAKAYPTGPAKQDPEERKKLSTPIKQSEPKPTVKRARGVIPISKEERDKLHKATEEWMKKHKR